MGKTDTYAHTHRLIVSDYRRSMTIATSEASKVPCRPLGDGDWDVVRGWVMRLRYPHSLGVFHTGFL